MAPALFDVVYRGKRLPGFDRKDVKSKLMKLFSISEDKAAKILQSKGMALKKGTDEISAKKYETALRRIGMEVVLTSSKIETDSVETPMAHPDEGTTKQGSIESEKVKKADPAPAEEDVNTDPVSSQEGNDVSKVPLNLVVRERNTLKSGW